MQLLEKEDGEESGGAGPSTGLNKITKLRFLSRDLGSEVHPPSAHPTPDAPRARSPPLA